MHEKIPETMENEHIDNTVKEVCGLKPRSHYNVFIYYIYQNSCKEVENKWCIFIMKDTEILIHSIIIVL